MLAKRPSGSGPNHRAKVDVHGGRQQIDAVRAAFGVGTAVNGPEIGLKQLPHHLVGIIIVIAIPGRFVQQHQAHPLVARKISS